MRKWQFFYRIHTHNTTFSILARNHPPSISDSYQRPPFYGSRRPVQVRLNIELLRNLNSEPPPVFLSYRGYDRNILSHRPFLLF